MIKALLYRLFLTNWPRKLVALISAVVIWFLVSQTMTITRTIPDVAVRIINLPADKTVVGLLPNGVLSIRITTTLTGNKSALSDLSSKDIEILINADGQKESWIATISKKNLVNLSPEVDLKKKITSVTANDILIKMSRLVTAEIPVTIAKPIGDPPQGYQFLDIWPSQLVQKVSGPQEQIHSLKERGLEIVFNLNRVSKAELDALRDVQSGGKKDEIGFPIPESWKQVAIPFRENTLEPLNDPRAQFLKIDFLKQELIPLGIDVPVSVFFPLKYSRTLNPETYALATGVFVEKKNGIKLLNIPLYARDVSRLFLDVVRNNIEITLIATPKSLQDKLDWAITFYDLDKLEDQYVLASLKETKDKVERELQTSSNESYLRNRFRDYIRHFVLYSGEERPLEIIAKLEASTISLQVILSPA